MSAAAAGEALRAGVPGAEYRLGGTSLAVTLKRLKLFATLAPIVVVIALEVARPYIIGSATVGQRFAMDAVAVLAIVAFSMVIFRFVDQMQERLRRQNEELLALHSAGLDVASELSLDVVLKKVVELARTLVGARYGALSVVDSEGRIEQFITAGITTEERARIGPPPVGHGVLGVVLRQGQTLRLNDVTKHPHSAGFPPNHPVMRSLLAVPIPCKSPFLGNLYLSEKQRGGEFTEDDEATLRRFAVQAAIAIDNAHLHAQAADLAVARERLRIAHEMHDGIAQVLGYVNTKVQAANEYLRRGNVDDASVQLRQLSTSAREAYADVREAIIGLRALPSADRSFADVLNDFLERWKEQSDISATLSIESNLRLRPTLELQLMRIVQEAMTNVRKHAKANSVRIDIHARDGKLVAIVTDDGIGFNPAAKSRSDFPRFGLSTMKERAESVDGTLAIDSTPGKGTAVHFEVPLANATEPI